MNASKMKWVRLGDYIEEVDERNKEGIDYPFYGINKDKTFMPTVADTNNLDNTKYKLVAQGTFVFSGMQTGRDICIRIALQSEDKVVLISPAYTTFRVKRIHELTPVYLYMHFIRFEMDRYGWFLSDGSIRSNLDWDRFCDILIPLPSMGVQRDLVDAYEGLRRLAEDNEALIAPLTEACQAFIVDCKGKYPYVPLGEYIEEVDERNKDLAISLSQGIANTKVFQAPKQVSANSKSDKIVRQGQFAYNRATTRNGEKISIAYRTAEDCTVSSAYGVFKITMEELLNPHFLWMWFSRPEFDRYARYVSKGSAHEFFDWEELCRVQIPLPPLEVQQSIVNLYRCIEEAKSIAREARERLTTLCPALVQRAIHS